MLERAFDVVKLTSEVTDCSIVSDKVNGNVTTDDGSRPLMR